MLASNPLRLVALAALVALALILAGSPGAADQPAPKIVFLLAGQSNMLGRGTPVTEGEPSDSRLLSWRPAGWTVAVDPLGGAEDKDNGVGPGMTFGLGVIQANPSATVGLIQCSHGGTSIEEWQPSGQWYKACMLQVKAAKAVVAGVLFLQGETDAMTKKTAGGWAAWFTKLAAAFRHDLHTRIVLGQIGTIDAAKYPYQQVVRDQQAAIAKTLGAPLVKTLDLPVSGDGVHFTVPSYKTVGVRFAAAWATA